MARYYDRYSKFKNFGNFKPAIGGKINIEETDKYVVYRQGVTRFDKLSNTYYNTPYCGWLIMLANSEFGGLEFKIPDNTIIRIPFPFETAIQRYIQSVEKHIDLYGE